MMLELFVAFLQAFIFSLLASVFIGQIREAHDHADVERSPAATRRSGRRRDIARASPCARTYPAERSGKSVETRVSLTDGGDAMPRGADVSREHDFGDSTMVHTILPLLQAAADDGVAARAA